MYTTYCDPDDEPNPSSSPYSWSILFPTGEFVHGHSTHPDPVQAAREDVRVTTLAKPGTTYSIQVITDHGQLYDPYMVLAIFK